MPRLSSGLILLLTAFATSAAPAPKPGWDAPTDPGHDCKFDIKDGTVAIELPGSEHDLDPKRECFNAPRLLRDVEGDFVVKVRVRASFRPSAKSSVDGRASRVAAGLVVVPADKNYIRLDYGAYRRGGGQEKTPTTRMQGEKLGMNVELDWRPSDWKPDPRAEEENLYLGIKRQGKRISEAVSPDGETWVWTMSMEGADLPRKLKVGLAAYSTSTEPFKVRFDQFQLTRNEEKSK